LEITVREPLLGFFDGQILDQRYRRRLGFGGLTATPELVAERVRTTGDDREHDQDDEDPRPLAPLAGLLVRLLGRWRRGWRRERGRRILRRWNSRRGGRRRDRVHRRSDFQARQYALDVGSHLRGAVVA